MGADCDNLSPLAQCNYSDKILKADDSLPKKMILNKENRWKWNIWFGKKYGYILSS